jgi:hypothetical protein
VSDIERRGERVSMFGTIIKIDQLRVSEAMFRKSEGPDWEGWKFYRMLYKS